MPKKKQPTSTELVPAQEMPAVPVLAELQNAFSVVAGQGGKLTYNDKTGELRASVVKDGYAYSVEKKHIGVTSIQTMTSSPIGNSKEERKQQVVELAKAHPKANQTTLAGMVGVSQGTISTYLQEAKDEGLL